MHYQHSFHAGNFADVFKHVVLCGVLAALSRKDKPWCYLETHAGAGVYDLAGAGAARTGEWRDGIGRLFPSPSRESGGGEGDVLARYREIIADVRQRGATLYPGSPRIARALARPGDRLVLCENVPAVMAALRAEFAGDRQAAFHARDGYEAHALLPPAEKRGLVLVDPPFERRDEFTACGDFLEASLKRFAGGTYAVWYALKNRHEAAKFARRAARLAQEPPLNLEFDNGARAEGQMRACGMLLVNAPFGLERDLAPALEVLVRELAQGPKARYAIGPVT